MAARRTARGAVAASANQSALLSLAAVLNPTPQRMVNRLYRSVCGVLEPGALREALLFGLVQLVIRVEHATKVTDGRSGEHLCRRLFWRAGSLHACLTVLLLCVSCVNVCVCVCVCVIFEHPREG